jgi:hypothetical protein
MILSGELCYLVEWYGHTNKIDYIYLLRANSDTNNNKHAPPEEYSFTVEKVLYGGNKEDEGTYNFIPKRWSLSELIKASRPQMKLVKELFNRLFR